MTATMTISRRERRRNLSPEVQIDFIHDDLDQDDIVIAMWEKKLTDLEESINRRLGRITAICTAILVSLLTTTLTIIVTTVGR